MKQFKEGDEVVITGKVIAIYKGSDYPIKVRVAEDEFMFTLDGKNNYTDKVIALQHLSDIQQSQFTDEELQEIKDCVFFCHEHHVDKSKITLRGIILDKINKLLQSREEKQFLEMAEKFKDKYKVERYEN